MAIHLQAGMRCAKQADPTVLDQQPRQGQVTENPGLSVLGKRNPKSYVDDLPLVRPEKPIGGEAVGHGHGRLHKW